MAGKTSMAKIKGRTLLESSDSEDDSGLKINENYAERYEKWRGKEELQKFADRYGEDALKKLNNSDDEDSSSTDEDEDARELTVDVEKQFFKTLACLKKGDPRIYDSNTKFFEKKENGEEVVVKKKTKKEKPMFLRDYERKILLEKGGAISSSDDEVEEDERAMSPTFVQEQVAIKESFKSALEGGSDEEEEETGFGGLFQPKEKTQQQKEKEEDEYRQWLKGQKEELGNKEEESDLGALKSYWNNPELESGEAFLRDYILNKRYLESDDKGKKRSYDEIAHDSDEGGFSGDEEMVEKMEQFEHKYNFRFEEPDQEFLKRYPRTMTGSMRQKDDRRKLNREEVKERKKMEKEQKRQELKQLKAIKRKEIEERLKKLKEVTGNADIEFEGINFEEDFDPDEHDRKMQKMFDEGFYQGEEEEEKPEFPDLDKELELENWDEFDGEEGEAGPSGFEPHCDDPDFNMDCDYNPKEFQKEMLANQTGRKKKKKRSKLAELLARKKPSFNRESQEIDKYMDEYYGLDYEDIVGDQPCRFKYRDVIGNSFGLSVEEILMADDKELNRWCTLKRTAQYRGDEQEWYDLKAYEKKGSMESLKRKILPSLFKDEQDAAAEGGAEEGDAAKNKRKKKKKKTASVPHGAQSNGDAAPSTAPKVNQVLTPTPKGESNENSAKPKQAKKRKASSEDLPQKRADTNGTPKKKKGQGERQRDGPPAKKAFKKRNNAGTEPKPTSTDMSDARLKAYGINPKKFKNKIKYGNKK